MRFWGYEAIEKAVPDLKSARAGNAPKDRNSSGEGRAMLCEVADTSEGQS